MLPLAEDLIQRWDLQDFKLIKGNYTWTNNRVGEDHIAARLDRILVQGTLMLNNKIITTKILPKLTSDHKPVQLILEDEEDLGPIPFRFSPLWIERNGFIDTVTAAWVKPVTGSSSDVWEQKLKATKFALKEWIRKPAPNPSSQRKEIVQTLEALQFEMESREITTSLLDKEVKIQCSLFRSFRAEEEHWRIKSRSLWLKAGDRNTTFFHRQYRERLSKNHISEITTIEGKICKGFSEIKEATISHFKSLYTAGDQGSEEDIADLLSNIPLLVSPEDNSTLTQPITEEEIIKVILSMDPDKAPGPDGFTIHFYKTCWDIIKGDLIKMIKGFMKKAKVGGGTNSTYLALIPKETNPETFARFRPISLCNASYKIIAKLLATRMKPLRNKLISSNQGGFVEGRNILDNVIQVHETIHSSNQRKEKGMLINLDMANAFDRVNRSFLYKVLHSFGFSPHFVDLIVACTHNPWIAPLVNGSPTSFFQAQRGLRQGCPLSPFLYILMADSLSRKLASEQSSSSLPGLKPSIISPALNHALFADDSLLLGGAFVRIAKAFESVLKRYCRVSGASINERKIEVYETIGKIKTKIASWGGHWLTKGGKVILIKSVLSALPIYQAAFLLAPKKVTDNISRILHDFLWQGGKGNQHKIHLVKSEKVKRPTLEGGLQIHDPALVNLALGGKILWKLFKEPTHPVSATLKAKDVPNVPLRNLQTSQTPKNTHVWKLCNKSLNFFKEKVYKIPGNGKCKNMWHDRIMDRNPISETEEIAEIKDWLERAGINNVFDLSKWDRNGDWQGWDFFGVPNRLQQQKYILEDLPEDATPVNRKSRDCWGWGCSGTYTTAEVYNAIKSDRNNNKTPEFWRKVWELLALPKVNFFFWMLVQDKLLTGDNLMKTTLQVRTDVRCAEAV
eukprot:PITA_22852